ncbi:MAG: Lrp/AsnC ligand binding domain-containing protein [Candidatus Hydrothermarchaeota archaeon]
MLVFVYICTEIGKEGEVAEELKRLPEVKEIHGALGEHDIIIKLEEKDLQSIEKVVMKRIRSLKGITSTRTVITFPI